MNPSISTRLCLSLLALFCLSSSRAGILWYTGDSAGGGTVNEVGVANLYEIVNVTDPGGWTVQGVWSDDLMSYTGVTSAAWSIRSGMSAGNGGTIVASGTSSATQSPTGRSAYWGAPEYAIQVTGLNVYLSPGTYWLSVSPDVGSDPIASGMYRSYISQTGGANAIGTPPSASSINSFLYYPAGGYNFTPDRFNENYSIGVIGTVVPEPSAFALAVTGLVLWMHGRRRAK